MELIVYLNFTRSIKACRKSGDRVPWISRSGLIYKWWGPQSLKVRIGLPDKSAQIWDILVHLKRISSSFEILIAFLFLEVTKILSSLDDDDGNLVARLTLQHNWCTFTWIFPRVLQSYLTLSKRKTVMTCVLKRVNIVYQFYQHLFCYCFVWASSRSSLQFIPFEEMQLLLLN